MINQLIVEFYILLPTTCIFCSNFRGNLVPIVFLVITYHIICKDNAFYLFNDRFAQKIMALFYTSENTCLPKETHPYILLA